MMIYFGSPTVVNIPIWSQSVYWPGDVNWGSLKRRFVHQHKGKKPKRGNPRRQPLFSFR